MGAGHGTCEDRGCGNEGCVEEFSSHSHIDMLHRSSKYCTHYRSNIEVSYSRFSPVLVLVPWQDFSTLQKYINIYHTITNVMHYRMHYKA